jgi:predicted SnoaL-like aldol condensation-catalyzing enzyme
MIHEKNKALVLEAFEILFNKRDYAAAPTLLVAQVHSTQAHIGPGGEGLFCLVESQPSTLRFEPGTIIADEEFVIVHGRYSGFGQLTNWIVADIVRVADGVLAEHWDVIQDEVTQEQSKSGLPMFGTRFPVEQSPKE